jgi:hypothetical protein
VIKRIRRLPTTSETASSPDLFHNILNPRLTWIQVALTYSRSVFILSCVLLTRAKKFYRGGNTICIDKIKNFHLMRMNNKPIRTPIPRSGGGENDAEVTLREMGEG